MENEISINHGTQPDAKHLLCSRCGFLAVNFNRGKVF